MEVATKRPDGTLAKMPGAAAEAAPMRTGWVGAMRHAGHVVGTELAPNAAGNGSQGLLTVMTACRLATVSAVGSTLQASYSRQALANVSISSQLQAVSSRPACSMRNY